MLRAAGRFERNRPGRPSFEDWLITSLQKHGNLNVFKTELADNRCPRLAHRLGARRKTGRRHIIGIAVAAQTAALTIGIASHFPIIHGRRPSSLWQE